MRKILVSFVVLTTFLVLISSFMMIDKTKTITQKWILTELRINKQIFNQEYLANKQKNTGKTILEFLPNGVVYLHIKTPKSKLVTQTNRWKFEGEKGNKLIIQTKSTGEETSQIFDIIKLSSKRLVLANQEGKDIQVFTYKPFKD